VGDPVAERKSRSLYVAGVAGGVGTSTWTRAFRSQVRVPVVELGVFVTFLAGIERASGPVDVLVTSNTAAATAQIGGALAKCERPPLLVVMHTVPGSIGAARAHLRKAKPHITRRFDVPHQHMWLELDEPPGSYVPKSFTEIVHAVPAALHEMYSGPPKPRPAGVLAHELGMQASARGSETGNLAHVSHQGGHALRQRHSRGG
jgi:hypothetical protein